MKQERRAVPAPRSCARAKMRAFPPRPTDMQHLTIVTTGGTIDKIYFDDKSDYKIGAPQIGEILRQLGVAVQFGVIPILRKDQLGRATGGKECVITCSIRG